jgi:hypothetical protein
VFVGVSVGVVVTVGVNPIVGVIEGVGVFVGVIEGVGVKQSKLTTTPFNISVLV